ncbi:MAG TPA: hypothetical protein VKB84_06065 [Candidatus Binataceae bacterium]|nr:hypothetical protein [Candidatus Binataceae bacterium]
MKRAHTVLAVCVLWIACLPAFALTAHAQANSPASQPAAEPSTQAKIAQLEAAKHALERQARETNGYQESLRQMKVLKIDDLISKLKSGQNVPQSKIDRTIRHVSLPLYHAPGT